MSACGATAEDGTACFLECGHRGRHYRGEGRYFDQTRTRPQVMLTLSPEASERLSEIARRSGSTRSAVVEGLVRAARLPR